MAFDFQPPKAAGPLASKWLMKSGTLNKAEQLFLDTWMTRRSRDMRDTILKECKTLHDIGILEQLPNMRIIPQIETVAQAGSRKFLQWAHQVEKAIPEFVRSGFKNVMSGLPANPSLGQALQEKVSEPDPFEEIESRNDSSFMMSREQIVQKDGYNWGEPILSASYVVLGTKDLKSPLVSNFPSLDEATMFVFHHELAHAAMTMRRNYNPIVAGINVLAKYENDEDFTKDGDWVQNAWRTMLNIRPSGENGKLPGMGALDIQQERWEEYYADVGAAFLHARSGYTNEYMANFCNHREQGHLSHKTDDVLRELNQILDFHPIVLNEKIDSFDLHRAIGYSIAPQITRDVLALTSSSKDVAQLLEKGLPDLSSSSQMQSPEYTAMNDALGGQYPKLAMFFAKIKDGPDVAAVAKAFEGQLSPKATRSMEQQIQDFSTSTTLTFES